MRKPYFPLFIDLSQKKVVVVGGGRIAQRRVKTLLEFTGHIRVAAPELTEELRALAGSGRVEWMEGAYSRDAVEGADLVLAATADAACNEAVVRDCRRLGIPVNASHKKELCDFYFPAVAVQGNVVAGITASGQDHEQAREAREKVERALRETAD